MARSGKALLAAALVMSMLVLQVAASRNLKDVLVIDEPLVTPVVAADPDDPTLGGGSPNPDGSSGGIWGNTTVDGGGAPPSQVDPEDGSPVRLYVLTQWKAGSDLKTLADLEWDRINRCKLASDGTTPRLAAGVAGANSNAFLAGGIFGSFAKVLDFASPWDCLDFVDCLSSDLAAEYLAPYETGDGGAIYAMSSIAAEQIGALAAGEVVHVALLSPLQPQEAAAAKLAASVSAALSGASVDSAVAPSHSGFLSSVYPGLSVRSLASHLAFTNQNGPLAFHFYKNGYGSSVAQDADYHSLLQLLEKPPVLAEFVPTKIQV